MTDTTEAEAKAQAEYDEAKALDDAKVSIKKVFDSLSPANKNQLVDYIPRLVRKEGGGY